MNIYIASSWKNQHAVEMLTYMLRERNCNVWSFIENNHGEQNAHEALDDAGKPIPFEKWVWSDRGTRSFEYDTQSAMRADCVLYLSPSGNDAWAELGCAFASGVPIIGLWAKGEQVGLMRRLVKMWCMSFQEMLNCVEAIRLERKAAQ